MQFEVPSVLPGPIKEQLKALAPYMLRHTPKSNGGFVIELKIPIDSFVTFDLNNDELARYNMRAAASVDPPEPAHGGMIMRYAEFADVKITYK
jgi:hypothetical protein